MQRVKYTAVGIAAAVLMAMGSSAIAGDCKSVKFKFYNDASSKVKVKKVKISGNDGTWTENIANKKILKGKTYTTDARRMNKLDSGKAPGYMTVTYDRWNAGNSKWDGRTEKVTGLKKCNDGKTYHQHVD